MNFPWKEVGMSTKSLKAREHFYKEEDRWIDFIAAFVANIAYAVVYVIINFFKVSLEFIVTQFWRLLQEWWEVVTELWESGKRFLAIIVFLALPLLLILSVWLVRWSAISLLQYFF